MKILYYLLVLPLLFLSACYKRTEVLPKPIQKISYQKKVTVKVEGVECLECETLLLAQLRVLKGVTYVEFRKPNNDYEQGYVALYYDPALNTILAADIQQAVESEGFILKNIE